jgi:preprotein translocase subunit SecG
MYTLVVIMYVIVCFFLILVVLLQQGKGADVAAAFGGAGSQTSFGPRGSTTLMHKLTTGSFVLFVALCIGLAVMKSREGRSVASGIKATKAPATAPVAPGTAPQKSAPANSAPAPQQPAKPAPAPGK